MQESQCNRLDLNLLAIFDAIMSERSLTKAGKRLGMTQSAVSHALARLREVTGDHLFERTGRGVRPTARATDMAVDVREALDQLRSTLRHKPPNFCSTSAVRRFLIDIPGGIDCVIGPALAAKVVDSPGLSFRISGGRAKSILHELRYGETWLAFDYEPADAAGYRTELLLEDPYVIVARPGNNLVSEKTTRQEFEELEQVAFMPEREQGPSPLSQRLERHGVKRRVKYAVPNLVSVAAVAAASDLVGMMPLRVARGLQSSFRLAMHPCPFELPPMPIYMVWHENFENDEGHIWLRGTLREIAEAI